jgi:hypothetical protein
MSTRAALAAAGLIVAATWGTAGAASADPQQNIGQVTITCDNGSTYQAVLFSNGEWSPALDTASNAVLVPLTIGPSHIVVTDAEGNVVEDSTDPSVSVKGDAVNHVTATSCTFLIEGPTDEGGTFRLEGSVVALVTPVRG